MQQRNAGYASLVVIFFGSLLSTFFTPTSLNAQVIEPARPNIILNLTFQ